MRFATTIWRVLRGERLVREVTDSYGWHALDTALLAQGFQMTGRWVSRVEGELLSKVALLSGRLPGHPTNRNGNDNGFC